MLDDHPLEHAKHRDQQALTTLLKRHGPAARQAIAGRIPRKWQAVLSEDDVIQQTYADAVAKIGQLTAENEGEFAGWLCSIARCRLNDALKGLATEKRGGDRRQVSEVATSQSFVNLIDLLSGGGATPSKCAGGQEAIEALKKAVEVLPSDYRQVVRLYDIEGLSAVEAAKAMNRSQGAIFMLRARAHERLHEIMGATSAFFSKSS